MNNKYNKTAYYAVFLALMLIISYLETRLSVFIPVPGVKIGLSNIVVLVVMYKMGNGAAFLINIVRIFLTGILFGNGYSLLYSLAGGIVSFILMAALKKSGAFSKTGVSIAGAFGHNTAQILVACYMLKNETILYYLPVLLVSAVVTGMVVGMLGAVITKRVY